MKYIILCSVILLGGCSTGCHTSCFAGIGPGNSVFDSYAGYMNRTDPCQYIGKPEGYTLPGYCHTNANKSVKYVYDKNGKLFYLVK